MDGNEKEPRPKRIESNSHKAKEERASVEPVAKGRIAKKPLDKKFQEAFLGDEARNVKSYLIWDVLIPAAKDMVADLVKKGIDAILYGKAKPAENVQRDRGSSYVSYNSYSRGRYETRSMDPPWNPDHRPRYNRRAALDFDYIDFDTRDEAEKVLSSMADILDAGQEVSVADFYELSGEKSSWTDNGYGWYDISGVRVSRNARGRWYIDLPRPVGLSQ